MNEVERQRQAEMALRRQVEMRRRQREAERLAKQPATPFYRTIPGVAPAIDTAADIYSGLRSFLRPGSQYEKRHNTIMNRVDRMSE